MQNVKVLEETAFRLSDKKVRPSEMSYWQLYRWAMEGWGREEPKVSLEWARMGKMLYTSHEAVERFLKKINEGDSRAN